MKKSSKRQIAISFFLVFLVCIALSASLNIFSKNAVEVQRREATNKIESTSQTARNLVETQINGNFQTMITLASLLGSKVSVNDAESLSTMMQLLYTINEQNNFVRMGFIDTNGIGNFVYLHGEIEWGLDFSQDENMQRALQGEQVFTRTLWDDNLQEYVNRYLVPIYEGGTPYQQDGAPSKIIGVLCGSHYTNTLRYMLSANLFNDVGVNHIITDDGTFVVRNTTYFAGDALNLFDSPAIDSESADALLSAFADRQAAYMEVEANGTFYDLYFRPLSYNNWYIVTVVPHELLVTDISHWLMLQRATFYSLFFLFCLLAFYIYYTMQQNTKTMYQLAYIDPVTECWNSHRFMNELPNRLGSTPKALVMLETDNGELVKNLYGLEAFNRLQKHIALCLKRSLQGKELYASSPKGWILLLDDTNEEDVTRRLEELLADMQKFSINAHQNLHLIFSCGIRFVSKHDQDLETIMLQTSLTVDSAKRQRRDEIIFYRPSIYEPILVNNQIENCMEEALANEEFQVWLQPKINLSTGALTSAEALVRWIRPDGSMVYPGQFVPLFERNGFCVDLDYYMLEHVCRQLREWLDQGLPVVPVSVNQCRLMFYEKNYINQVLSTLERYNIPPHLVVLEVTESLAMENTERMYSILNELRSHGLHISMDDFGSGFSSLNSLKDLPIDELKLDRVFLSTSDNTNAAKRDLVIKGIVQMAHSLNLTTVIEGVETAEQAQMMLELGCDVAQGYYYNKPLTCTLFCEHYFGTPGSNK